MITEDVDRHGDPEPEPKPVRQRSTMVTKSSYPPEHSSPFRFSLPGITIDILPILSDTQLKRVRVRLFPLVFSRHRILLHLFITFILPILLTPGLPLCTLSHPLQLPLRIHDYDYRDDYFSTIHRSL